MQRFRTVNGVMIRQPAPDNNGSLRQTSTAACARYQRQPAIFFGGWKQYWHGDLRLAAASGNNLLQSFG
jgi:hypothetical protein